MPKRSQPKKLAIAAALGLSITFAPACAVHHGHGGSYSTYWYEDVGIALVAAAVFVLAACSGGHGHYHGHYGHYGHGYHGWGR